MAAANRIPRILFAAVVICSGCIASVSAAPAPALQQLPGIKIYSQQRVIYLCAGEVRVPVRYLITNAGALAYLPAGGRKLLFASVMTASGAKYVADRYVWWTKGKEAFLEDATQPEDAAPVLKDCVQVEKW